MNGEIRCPKCHGDKFTYVSEGTYKCAYCGNVFTIPKQESTSPAVERQSEDNRPQVIVNITQPGMETVEPEKDRKKSCAKGCFVAIVILALLFMFISMFGS